MAVTSSEHTFAPTRAPFGKRHKTGKQPGPQAPVTESRRRAGIVGAYRRSYTATELTAIILEYRDAAAFGATEATIAKVRAALRADPKWKALSDVKLNMRVEKETVVADELLQAR